jgi:hypothetical protein
MQLGLRHASQGTVSIMHCLQKLGCVFAVVLTQLPADPLRLPASTCDSHCAAPLLSLTAHRMTHQSVQTRHPTGGPAGPLPPPPAAAACCRAECGFCHCRMLLWIAAGNVHASCLITPHALTATAAAELEQYSSNRTGVAGQVCHSHSASLSYPGNAQAYLTQLLPRILTHIISIII